MENTPLLCSECFEDHGLKLYAAKLGFNNSEACPNCTSKNGFKLDSSRLDFLAYKFFVVGSTLKFDFGAAPLIQYNDKRETDVTFKNALANDSKLLSEKLGKGFFHYGPRFWMFGEIEPLKDLQSSDLRETIFKRILNEYPTLTFSKDEFFYRLRKSPEKPDEPLEYDSPPNSGGGRLDSPTLRILYASQDLEICVHECRVTVDDTMYIATMKATRDLKLLDLSEILAEECTEFESLDLAVLMLFLAGKHAYEISKELARYVNKAGYDGIIYPSYFSLARTGGEPFPTVYGISNRRIQQYREAEKSKIISNMALFGHPVKDGLVHVTNINRLLLNQVAYDIQFGPVSFN